MPDLPGSWAAFRQAALVVRECVQQRKGAPLLALTYLPEGGAQALLAITAAAAIEAAEDEVGDEDEVMPARKEAAVDNEIRCDWACDHALMTPREAEHGYCSERRCKRKLHHF